MNAPQTKVGSAKKGKKGLFWRWIGMFLPLNRSPRRRVCDSAEAWGWNCIWWGNDDSILWHYGWWGNHRNAFYDTKFVSMALIDWSWLYPDPDQSGPIRIPIWTDQDWANEHERFWWRSGPDRLWSVLIGIRSGAPRFMRLIEAGFYELITKRHLTPKKFCKTWDGMVWKLWTPQVQKLLA
jgi:hypothetical protein